MSTPAPLFLSLTVSQRWSVLWGEHHPCDCMTIYPTVFDILWTHPNLHLVCVMTLGSARLGSCQPHWGQVAWPPLHSLASVMTTLRQLATRLFFLVLGRKTHQILSLGKCGDRDMVPIWSCASYPLTPSPTPLGVGQLLCTLAWLASLSWTRLSPMWVGPHAI